MKIKVFEKIPGCMPGIIAMGDWIDLALAEDVILKGPHAKTLHHKTKAGQNEKFRDVIFDSCLASLGVCIKVPEGYECVVVPRSSTFKKYGIIQSNSMGVIDQVYNGPEDVWKMPIVATRATYIPKGTRIAQFKVQLSQKATVWQKIKWLFSSPPRVVKLRHNSGDSRGGFGSTGER